MYTGCTSTLLFSCIRGGAKILPAAAGEACGHCLRAFMSRLYCPADKSTPRASISEASIWQGHTSWCQDNQIRPFPTPRSKLSSKNAFLPHSGNPWDFCGTIFIISLCYFQLVAMLRHHTLYLPLYEGIRTYTARGSSPDHAENFIPFVF